MSPPEIAAYAGRDCAKKNGSGRPRRRANAAQAPKKASAASIENFMKHR
ncbi:MAG: hypothetical protein BWY99_02683 [Synergistetes bacterium ADurb.BinA166]|nr:MAG: hypothetical protein BWY99_02683 [Synergistetes bacterium ADurb.BinA166]